MAFLTSPLTLIAFNSLFQFGKSPRFSFHLINCLQCGVVSPPTNLVRGLGSKLVQPLSFDLFGKGVPTRRNSPADVALWVIEACKPTHQRQGNDPKVGLKFICSL